MGYAFFYKFINFDDFYGGFVYNVVSFLLGCLCELQTLLLDSAVFKPDIILITVFVQVTSHYATLLQLPYLFTHSPEAGLIRTTVLHLSPGHDTVRWMRRESNVIIPN
jgi:hypothetical protein